MLAKESNEVTVMEYTEVREEWQYVNKRALTVTVCSIGAGQVLKTVNYRNMAKNV